MTKKCKCFSVGNVPCGFWGTAEDSVRAQDIQLDKERVYLKIEKRRNHPAAYYLPAGSDLTALDASRGGDCW